MYLNKFDKKLETDVFKTGFKCEKTKSRVFGKRYKCRHVELK